MRTSLHISQEVLDSFDETWKAEGFESRSRAVREAIGEYTEAHATLEAVSGDIAAVLAFDYEHRTAIAELHTTQHEFQDIIDTTSHTHQGEWCLEAIFCRGSAERVRKLTYRLRDFDAVGRVNVLSLQQ